MAGGVPYDTWPHLFGLPNVSQAGLELVVVAMVANVMWHGETFYGLEFQGVEVLILLGALFPPSVAPTSQQGFGVTQLTLSGSAPHHHLGSSSNSLFNIVSHVKSLLLIYDVLMTSSLL
jgi:hypothetical protein